jgi:hypothetical protein
MENERFLQSAGGRLVTASAATALFGAATVALFGPGPYAVRVAVSVTLAAIVGSIMGVGLLVDKFGIHAFGLILGLPVIAVFYFALLMVAPAVGAVISPIFFAAGLAVVAIAILGQRRDALVKHHAVEGEAKAR